MDRTDFTVGRAYPASGRTDFEYTRPRLRDLVVVRRPDDPPPVPSPDERIASALERIATALEKRNEAHIHRESES